MRRTWRIAGAAMAVTLVGLLVFAGVTLAEEPAATGRLGRGLTWMGDRLGDLRETIARKLGVETDDLDTAVQEAHQEMIDQAVADGKITQEQAERMLSRGEGGFPGGKMGFPGGRRGGLGITLGQADVLADTLGLTLDELREKLAAGETLAEIAEGQGVDLEAVRAELQPEQVEAQKARIQQAVEDGTMTRERADWMLQGLDQGYMPMRGGSRGGRGGSFGGFCR